MSLIGSLPSLEDLTILPCKMLPQIYHPVTIMAVRFAVIGQLDTACTLLEYAVDAREIAEERHGRPDAGHRAMIDMLLEEIRSMRLAAIMKSSHVFTCGQIVGEAMIRGVHVPESMFPPNWTLDRYRQTSRQFIVRNANRKFATESTFCRGFIPA